MTPPVLEAEGLRRSYRRPRGSVSAGRPGAARPGGGRIVAVDGVSLAVGPGEAVGLVGESGCGKSTLARLLVGLEAPDKGTVRYRGRPVGGLSGEERRRFRLDVQMVFQDPTASLNPRLTVGSAVGEPLVVHGLAAGRDVRESVARTLRLVGLDAGHIPRYPHQLSGGERQRVALARALVLRPGLLVADEPVTALDVSVQARILNLLRTLRDELELALLFIAHDLSAVRYLCDRVAVMEGGRIVEEGTTARIFGSPEHRRTRRLLEAVPSLELPASGAGDRRREGD